ncbi:peptidylprolyl isomerase [Mucilaginibacter gracilis]|uniref:peptidylprolyl isomerase n=1 Tax=Mucilaginibacter gracilis TaxID=423350 RepID=A0A495JAK8_9SPHI|nr:FKBP-type peptidyl-prolyl cis-trans isomerase [Mucilaginibacter gracilis]RKR85508.1 peptidylprolyl isomerase [Mucilaginibacter gracilis]
MNIKHFLLSLTAIAFLNQAKAQELTLKTTPKGLAYHIFTANAGTKIKVSDVITFNVIQKTDKDSVLFSTYKNGTAVKLQVQPSQNIGDLMDIFPLLADKDSALVKVPTDSIFVGHEEQRPPFLGKGSSLVFILKIEKIQSVDEAMAERNAAMEKAKAEGLKLKAAEMVNLQKYIADKKIAAKATPSGLNYVVNVPTLKRKPLNGDTVYVNYVGHTLEGKVFDTSIESIAKAAGINQPGRPYEPLDFVLGKARVIKGWEEGFLLLHEGEKATFIIPSALAYGEQGAGADIKPYSTLVFEVELVKVKPGKHPVAKPAVKKKTTLKKPLKKKPVVNK